MRSVPTTYTELREALLNHVFPEERYWIDFKRQLYPIQPAGQTPKPAERRHAHEELARDMASMAIRGGYLVYGVAEDKQAHTFDPVGMELSAGLRETVDSIARDKITPPLLVEPTLLRADDTTTPQGFMVIHIPESPDAPHMVNGTYHGRSDTGRTVLTDDDVEWLIMLRHRQYDRLQEQVKLTIASDPIQLEQRQVPHLYFTAVPTRPSPDMFLPYARDRNAASQLIQLCLDVINNQQGRQTGRISGRNDTLVELSQHRRGSQSPTMWLDGPGSHARSEGLGRAVGVDDDGGVRFISLAGGTLSTGENPGILAFRESEYDPQDQRQPMAYEESYLWEVYDVLLLTSRLCQAVSYAGGWYLNVHVDRLVGYGSSNNMRSIIGNVPFLQSATYDAELYSESTRVTSAKLMTEPRSVTASLLRLLFRSLGNERYLDQWVAAEN